MNKYTKPYLLHADKFIFFFIIYTRIKSIFYKNFMIIFFFNFIFLSCKNIYHVNDNICDDGLYEPVCGNNGANFPNSCYAENSGITIYTEGECE